MQSAGMLECRVRHAEWRAGAGAAAASASARGGAAAQSAPAEACPAGELALPAGVTARLTRS